MANQGSDRRTILEIVAKAALAGQFSGFAQWSFAQVDQGAQPESAKRPATYRPAYFSAAEYRTIEILTEIIIPRDESPGARDAGVSEFIDFLAASGEKEIREPMRDGLRWLDSEAIKQDGVAFADISSERQTDILRYASRSETSTQEQQQGHTFFRLIRRYTVMGYYTSRIGLTELDYPGLRIYGESPACPHQDDPEHIKLRPR